MLLHQLLLVGHISTLWNHALFFQKGHNTEWLFNQIERGLQVHAKIFKDPVDALLLVLFLLENEHVMVEELLESLVGIVDAELLKSVELENFETGNIQNTNEESTLNIGGQGTINDFYEPVEKAAKNGLGKGTERIDTLLDGLTLDDVFCTDLDFRRAHGFEVFVLVDAKKSSNLSSSFLCLWSSLWLGLLLTGLLLEGNITGMHNSSSNHVNSVLLALIEAQNIKRLISGLKLDLIINRLDFDLTQGAPAVIIGIGRNGAHFINFWLVTGTNLVKDVKAALGLQLEGNSRLFKQISVNITRGENTARVEVNSDKFTESRRVVITDCFGITIGFHGGVGGNNLILKGTTAT